MVTGDIPRLVDWKEAIVKTVTCRDIAKEHARIASRNSRTPGLWHNAYAQVARVCQQHVAHKARAVRKLQELVKTYKDKSVCVVYATAACLLTGTRSG